MANNFIILAADKHRVHQHLFMEVWYLDKKHLFLVDSGSDSSYLYFKPLKVRELEAKAGEDFSLGGNENQVPAGAIIPMIWDHDLYYYMDKPEIVLLLEKQYKLTLSGLVGLDYLIKNKIVLDFAQL